MKRIRYIDAAKGFGILLVIIHHTYGFRNGQFFNACFMALFFILSALTFRERDDLSPLAEGWRRAWPLLRSYLLYLPPVLLAEILINRVFFHTSPSADWLIKAVGGMLYSRISLYPSGTPAYQEIMINVPMWFIPALAAGYMLFVPLRRLLCRAFVRSRKFGWMALAVFAAAAIALSDLMARLPVLLPWSLDMILITAVFMLAGYGLQKLQLFRQDQQTKTVLITAAAALAVYAAALLINRSTVDYAQRLYGSGGSALFVLLGLSGSLFFIAVCFLLRDTIAGKVLAFLGRHSLFILVFHQAVHIALFQTLVGRLNLRYTLGLAAAEWVLMLIILICGVLVLERLKKLVQKIA